MLHKHDSKLIRMRRACGACFVIRWVVHVIEFELAAGLFVNKEAYCDFNVT
jgi:hypothetical protein